MKHDFMALRSRIDLEGKYVEFSFLRTVLTVERVVRDLETDLTEPNQDGECRGTCPKCDKPRSLAVNINTNRFNCFRKGCFLKGGGVIDLIAKLLEVPAKEASHLLACAYGIQPYSPAGVSEEITVQPAVAQRERSTETVSPDQPAASRAVVSRAEFEVLREKVERLSIIVWSRLFETGEIEAEDQLFADELPADKEWEAVRSG